MLLHASIPSQRERWRKRSSLKALHFWIVDFIVWFANAKGCVKYCWGWERGFPKTRYLFRLLFAFMHLFSTHGCCLTWKVSEFMRYAPVDVTGKFDYTEFIRLLKHGSKDSATEALEWYGCLFNCSSNIYAARLSNVDAAQSVHILSTLLSVVGSRVHCAG